MRESFIKNRTGIFLILISAVCACIGQLFWKLSVEHGIYFMLIGFVFYGLGAIIMLIAFKYGSLSVLQPLLSINYVFCLILAAVVLHEPITVALIIGILLIMIGVVLIGGGDS